MNSQTTYIIAMTAICFAVTILLRAFPFLLFGSGRECPKIIRYIGRVLSPAAIAMLVVYCLCAVFRNKGFAENGFGISELAASLTVIALHLWKRNPMLSILCGTILYMVLVQKVF